VRIAPNEIAIADGAALGPIYSEKGGFRKAACYRNFDIDGHPSIFSALEPGYRAPRAKAVVGMFSTTAVRRDAKGVLEESVRRLVGRMMGERTKGRSVDVLNLARSLAVDAVTGYLFGQSYGATEEEGKEEMSASQFVNAFVAVGRFFLLPNWWFVMLESLSEKVMMGEEKEEVNRSMQSVDEFVGRLVQEAREEDTTYQGRMLRAGMTREETAAQCKDLIFAGTDSTGMNLGTICWQLARHPEK